MDTIGALFSAVVRADPTRPLLTYYDDASGERTELSGATLANWVAKTANLLVDGSGLGSGDTAAVQLPPHWQTAAVLLGCWSAGVTVDMEGGPADVAFVAADVLSSGSARPPGDVYGLALAPMAAPIRPAPPPGVQDYVVAVRAYGDQFRPVGPVGPALPGVSHGEMAARAMDRGLAAGARVLVDGDATPDPVDWLLAPLAAGGSIVLCRHADTTKLAGRAETEKVTYRLD